MHSNTVSLLFRSRPKSRLSSIDETDNDNAKNNDNELAKILERLHRDPGFIALLSGRQLELLAEMDLDDDEKSSFYLEEYKRDFLIDLQKAADRHLLEKNEIRDAVGLLKMYHAAAGGITGPPKANLEEAEGDFTGRVIMQSEKISPRKRRRDNNKKWWDTDEKVPQLN